MDQGMKAMQRTTGKMSDEGCQARPSRVERLPLPQHTPTHRVHSAAPAGVAEPGGSPAPFGTQSFLQGAQEEQQRAFGKVLAQIKFKGLKS